VPKRSDYDSNVVYELKRRMWKEAYKYAKELNAREFGKRSVSVLELIAVFRSMIDEANHNWIEGNRTWEDILANEP
jgi:4-alpha-glucanotransferase